MTSSMGRSNQRLPLACPMRTVSELTTQVRLSLADACVMMLPLSSPSCPSRRLGGLWPPGSGCRRAQNGNGRRSQKSEHDSARGSSRATTLPSADGADDGRAGSGRPKNEKALASAGAPPRTAFSIQCGIGEPVLRSALRSIKCHFNVPRVRFRLTNVLYVCKCNCIHTHSLIPTSLTSVSQPMAMSHDRRISGAGRPPRASARVPSLRLRSRPPRVLHLDFLHLSL